MDFEGTGDAELLNRHIGGRIRQRRRARGVSQADLAAAIGVTFQQVQKYESGANRVSAPVLWRISQLLEAAPGYWFEALPGGDADRARYDEAAQLLLTDDGQELARAFAGISARSARRVVIDVARELAQRGELDDARAFGET